VFVASFGSDKKDHTNIGNEMRTPNTPAVSSQSMSEWRYSDKN